MGQSSKKVRFVSLMNSLCVNDEFKKLTNFYCDIVGRLFNIFFYFLFCFQLIPTHTFQWKLFIISINNFRLG